MRSARPSSRPVAVAAIAVGVLLVLYGLGAATWVSSSDSTTRFVDLTYGDPPYGFSERAWAEVVARPYFNGGAWVLLVAVATVSALAVWQRSTRSWVAALATSLVAVVWTFTAVLALALIDLHVGAHLPVVGYLVVVGALLGQGDTRRRVPLLLSSAGIAGVGAVIVWFTPVVAYDSSCSLATRNRDDNQGACADVIATLTNWFVVLTAAAIVLAVTGLAVGIRSTRSRLVTEQIA